MTPRTDPKGTRKRRRASQPSSSLTMWDAIRKALAQDAASRSKEVRVELVEADDRIYVNVRDWGIGFDAAEVDPHRFGLRGIRERARLLGGRVIIKAAPNQGAQITAELPVG